MRAIKRLLGYAGILAAAAWIGFLARPVSYFHGEMILREYVSGVENREIVVKKQVLSPISSQNAGYRVHYLAEGPSGGPVVVLVHGLSGRAEDWRKLAPYLAKAGFRVYLPDLPGYGRSEQPADFSYSVRDEAEVVVGFLDALGLKQVDLGGWSMGGGIAQQVALRHPERVRRLMLFDSIGLNEKPQWDVRLFTPQTPAELDQLDALLMPHPHKVPGFIAQDILRVSRKNAWVVHRAIDAMMTGQDATDKLLPGLRIPVLLVWGAEDKITPLEQGEKMRELIPQSQLEIFQGCGHLAPGQCADRIGPKVVEFVKQ